jgi:hypothetical protein
MVPTRKRTLEDYMPRFLVEIEWMAKAIVEVKAPNRDKAEEKALEEGLPWDVAVESGNGDDTTSRVVTRDEADLEALDAAGL